MSPLWVRKVPSACEKTSGKPGTQDLRICSPDSDGPWPAAASHTRTTDYDHVPGEMRPPPVAAEGHFRAPTGSRLALGPPATPFGPGSVIL